MHYNSLLILLYFLLHTEIKFRNLAIFIYLTSGNSKHPKITSFSKF